MAIRHEYFGKIAGIHYIKFWTDNFGSFTRKFKGEISDINAFAENYKNKIIATYQTYQSVKAIEGNVYTHNGVSYRVVNTKYVRGMIYVYLEFNYNSKSYFKRLALDVEESLSEVNARIKSKIDEFLGV